MDRAELRRLEAAATGAPWKLVTANGGYEVYVYAPDERYESRPGNPSPVKVAFMPPAHDGMPYRDAAIIVAARNALPAILDAADRVDELATKLETIATSLHDALEYLEAVEYTDSRGDDVTAAVDAITAALALARGHKGDQ